jgi:hypothetical protein
MSACWPLKMPAVAKSVLISLADNANDSGYCWPSIESICERTCFGRTAVIDAIKWLESEGYLSANRENGRKTTYVVSANQSATRTGAPAEPVRQTDETSPPRGRDQSATRTLTVINRKEPSKEKDARARVSRPDGVTELVWSDFLAIRRAKKAPLTATALSGIEREAQKAGMTLGSALSICCERGWQAFRSDWIVQPARASPKPRSSAVEAGLALAGYGKKRAEVIDV